MTQTAVVVGVDVSKDGLDVALASAGEVQHFANDARGRAQLMKWLKRVGGRARRLRGQRGVMSGPSPWRWTGRA